MRWVEPPMNWIVAAAACICMPLAAGCGPTVTIDDDGDTGDGSGPGDTSVGTSVGTTPATSTTTAPPTTTAPEDEAGPLDETGPEDTGPPAATNQVDILFVVDNSSTMGEEQGNLAAAAEGFVDLLDAFALDYRIAITTTDNGNPWCNGTTPEGGSFRLSSCRERASEFVFEGATQVDMLQEACLDACSAETVTTSGAMWIESSGGVSNVEGTSVGEALACALPQGINGCGFEQPLESMYKAIKRTETDSEVEFGFLRPGAMTVIVIVSDEADCSHQLDTIFLPDDDRTFWSDPNDFSPTSAVCWRAGVACDGPDCTSVDLDPLGQQTTPDNASMRPVSRYVELLQALEDQHQAVTPGVDVVVELIGGFGPDGEVVYADSPDPDVMDIYGIGPGCTSSNGDAFPMVRALEVGATMGLPGVQSRHSICQSSLSSAMEAIAENILNALDP